MDFKKLSRRNQIGFWLTLLLVIQLFVTPAIPALTRSTYISPHYAYAHVIFSYFVITVIVLLEFDHLNDLHIDQLTLWLLIFSCFVRTRLGIDHEAPYLVPIALFGLLILFQVLKNHTKILKTSKWALIGGIIYAVLTFGATALFESVQVSQWLNPFYSTNLGVNIPSLWVYQLSFVILIEEIAFRAFLLGYLIKTGVNEKTAFTIQALLFWLMHYMRFANFITFFISIPIMALSTSIAVKKYRQLTPAIIVHMIVNVFLGPFINFLF